MDNQIDGTDGKLGRGFMSADKLEEINIGDGDKLRPTFISANLDMKFQQRVDQATERIQRLLRLGLFGDAWFGSFHH
jgi:hypothetical protein